MTLKEMLMTDQSVEINFSVLRKIIKMKRERLILDLVHKEMKVDNVKIHESTGYLDSLSNRNLKKLYLINIASGTKWMKLALTKAS